MYLYEISQYFDFVGLRQQCLKHLEEASLDIDAATPLLSFTITLKLVVVQLTSVKYIESLMIIVSIVRLYVKLKLYL